MSIIDTSKKQPRIIDTSSRQPKIVVTPSTEPKIVVTPSTEPKLDPIEVAKALGAEIVEHPKLLVGNTPELYAKITKQEYSVEVSKEEWEQLAALAQELSTPEQTATASQVGRALLRKALIDLTQGKQQLKASLQDKPAQAAE